MLWHGSSVYGGHHHLDFEDTGHPFIMVIYEDTGYPFIMVIFEDKRNPFIMVIFEDTGHPFIMVTSEDTWHTYIAERLPVELSLSFLTTELCRGWDSNTNFSLEGGGGDGRSYILRHHRGNKCVNVRGYRCK